MQGGRLKVFLKKKKDDIGIFSSTTFDLPSPECLENMIYSGYYTGAGKRRAYHLSLCLQFYIHYTSVSQAVSSLMACLPQLLYSKSKNFMLTKNGKEHR